MGKNVTAMTRKIFCDMTFKNRNDLLRYWVWCTLTTRHNFDSFILCMFKYNLHNLIELTVIEMSCGVYPGLRPKDVSSSHTDLALLFNLKGMMWIFLDNFYITPCASIFNLVVIHKSQLTHITNLTRSCRYLIYTINWMQ